MYSVALRMRSFGTTLLLAISASILTGCASIGPPEAPSLELPKPPTDLRATRKGDRVNLMWSIPSRTTERQSLRYLGGTRICRSLDAPLKECGQSIGVAPAPKDFAEERKAGGKKLSATYHDTLTQAIEAGHHLGFAYYAVDVLNTAGKGAGISNQVKVPLVPTMPPFKPFRVRAEAAGLQLSWACPHDIGPAAGIRYLFRIYRRGESKANDTKVAEIPATACAEIEAGAGQKGANSFLDQNFEWEQTYFYRGTVVSVADVPGQSASEVEGEDTPELTIFAHDVFPPAVPTGLQAVFSGPGQAAFIDLVWGPVRDADLEGYNIYRHEKGGPEERLNQEQVPSPAYRDNNVAQRRTYIYAVTAVDERGNESGRSEEASESVP